MTHERWTRGDYEIRTGVEPVDLDAVHQFLSNESAWAKGISKDLVRRCVENSLCFSLFHSNKQVGFARVISDFATIAYIGDVFVLDEHRGKGLGDWLVERILAHPALRGMRRWILVTDSAHALYAKHGFRVVAQPGTFMELHNPRVYDPD
jgi:GNAT superfamily N-acetyltransferase